MQRQLNPAHGIKPLDFGNDGTIGSVDIDGRLILLNTYHPTAGFVSLSTAPLFTEADRYNSQSVRKYRAQLAHLAGFGPQFDEEIIQRHAYLVADTIPQIELDFENGGSAIMTILVLKNTAVQKWEFKGIAPTHWVGDLTLQRCAYTQLTEGGPLAPISTRNEQFLKDGSLIIKNPILPWTCVISGIPISSDQTSSDDLIALEISENSDCTLFITYTMADSVDAAQDFSKSLDVYCSNDEFDTLLESQSGQWHKFLDGIPDDLILRRGLAYGRWMAIPSHDEATCILTDHVLLPLSWNRDAYFVAEILLKWGAEHYDIVRGHLIWMFEIAERTNFEWGRCYLANGKLKDGAYQLDQQLFPLLELCDYVSVTGDTNLLERLLPQIKSIVKQLLSRKIADKWLFPTDETPADDPIAYDYHFSSHVLFWYVFKRLHKFTPDQGYDLIAKNVYDDIFQYFIGEFEGQLCFAYATDGQGNFHYYHDANDTPVVLAPIWGFIAVDNPIWQHTIEFAFSAKNPKGYYQGHLGSVHTPSPWGLGDVQELLIAKLTNNQDLLEKARQSLQKAAQWDGALSEGYDGKTFEVVSRHWFAWPNAFYTSVQWGHND